MSDVILINDDDDSETVMTEAALRKLDPDKWRLVYIPPTGPRKVWLLKPSAVDPAKWGKMGKSDPGVWDLEYPPALVVVTDEERKRRGDLLGVLNAP